MNAIPPMPVPQQNHLLNALSADAGGRLYPYLELVQLPRGKVIHETGEQPRYAYFPVDAIIAEMAIIESGDSTEVSMVGNEGLVGTALFMGGESIPRQALVQSAGHAYRLLGKRLKEEFDRHGEVLHLLMRYMLSLITQTAQTAVCNRHHSIEQQLCRMLLQALDRIHGNELSVTQEEIARMLGVRRESVSDAAGRLKKTGLIECHRGRVKVLDRPGIEKRCCECYAVVRKETERLLPPPRNPVPSPAACHDPRRLTPAKSFSRSA